MAHTKLKGHVRLQARGPPPNRERHSASSRSQATTRTRCSVSCLEWKGFWVVTLRSGRAPASRAVGKSPARCCHIGLSPLPSAAVPSSRWERAAMPELIAALFTKSLRVKLIAPSSCKSRTLPAGSTECRRFIDGCRTPPTFPGCDGNSDSHSVAMLRSHCQDTQGTSPLLTPRRVTERMVGLETFAGNALQPPTTQCPAPWQTSPAPRRQRVPPQQYLRPWVNTKLLIQNPPPPLPTQGG